MNQNPFRCRPIGAIILAGVVSCSSPTDTVSEQGLIVHADDAASGGSSTSGVTTVPFTVRNNGTGTVWYQPCGEGILRNNENVWQAICFLSTTGLVEIPPGEEYSSEIVTGSKLEPGEYSLVVRVLDEQGLLPVEIRTSNPFRIEAR